MRLEMKMTRDAPLSSGVPAVEDTRLNEATNPRRGEGGGAKESSREKLQKSLWSHGRDEAPGVWKGTREAMIATLFAVVASLVFGGAAGDWFAPDEHGRLGQLIKIAGGTLLMGAAVCLLGSLVSGRNPVFWGVGMPLLVYVAGTFCAFVSGHAGVSAFLFGAPLFCGLAILAGVLSAYLVDRDE